VKRTRRHEGTAGHGHAGGAAMIGILVLKDMLELFALKMDLEGPE
jgi:hypothetical protein